MIHRLFLVVFVLLLSANNMFAQERDNKKYKDAKYLMDSKAYEEARVLFEELLAKDSLDLEVLYDLGYCEMYLGEYEKSINNFHTLYELLPEDEKDGPTGIDIQSLAAQNYQLLEQPAKAIEIYETSLKYIPDEDVEMKKVTLRQIEICENALALMARPVKLDVMNLGPEVNSKFDDHSPLITADENQLFFTSRRDSVNNELLPDGQYPERIYASNKQDGKWIQSHSLNSLFRKEGHEAAVSLSVDGSQLYIFKNDITGSNLYVSNYDGSNWSEPVKLPEPINSRYDETHATVSADNNTLYFTSNREGGLGGLDIYRIRKLPNGEWAKPENMRELNTQYDEETPMLHPNGKTIYFSSEGHNSMGKFDIFYSHMDDEGNWSAPKNIGYPINTPDDDFFFVPTTTQNQAYYASARYDGSYGGSDIYLIEYEEPILNKLAVFKGQVNTGDQPLENVRIYVRDAETNQQEGVYKPHPGTGKYVLILEAEKKYDIAYGGKGFDEVDKDVDVAKEMAFKKSDKALDLGTINLVYIAKVEEPTVPVPVAGTGGTGTEVGTGTITTVSPEGIPYYTVQFVSLRKPLETYKIFEEHGLDLSLIKMYECKDGWYRYAYGSYKGYKATLKVKNETFQNTPLWDDAFVRELKQYVDLVKEDAE